MTPAAAVLAAQTWVPPVLGPWALSGWERRWPGPARPATGTAAAAIVTAAAVSGFVVPLGRPGIGWLLGGVAGVAGLVVAALAVPHRTGPEPLVARAAQAVRRPWLTVGRAGWAAATLALLGVGTVRAAGWLFALCLLTAALTGGLAVTGGRSVRSVLFATVAPGIAFLRGLPWIAAGLTAVRRAGRGRSGPRLAVAGVVTAALLLVFGALFASADAAFASLIGDAMPDVDVGSLIEWGFVTGVAGAALAGAAYLLTAPPDLTKLDAPGTRRVRPLEWIIPLLALDLLFAAFVLVQLTVLFGGERHVLATAGLTYAEYARGGFWQLLVVTGLTLLVLAGAGRWAPRTQLRDRIVVRVLLGTLAALTLVIVGSALFRMDVYADAYGLTRLRLLVAVCELWLGILFGMILIAGIRLRAAWLPRAAVAAGVLAVLALAALNPDRLIAEHNIDRQADTGRLDVPYLSTLSEDAVPVLDRLPGPQRTCALRRLAATTAPTDWWSFNLARQHAHRLIAADPPEPAARCPAA